MKLTIIATAALTTALVATGSIAASAATVDPSPTVTCEVGNLWSKLPADLRGDLKDLRDLEPGEGRVDAAKGIRDAALAGDYGVGVQARAEAVKDHGIRSSVKLWALRNCG